MEKRNIYEALCEVMKNITPIKKEKTNTYGEKFKYRGIDDVMNSVHDIFASVGVFITYDVLERTEKERMSKSGGALFYVTLKIKFSFHAADGTNISTTAIGTAMDSGDKADNKCMAIALKYAITQMFMIPTVDAADDPDAVTHEVAASSTAATESTPAQADGKKYPDDTRPWLTEKQFTAAMQRISNGDAELFDKIKKEFRMKKDYNKSLYDAHNLAANTN